LLVIVFFLFFFYVILFLAIFSHFISFRMCEGVFVFLGVYVYVFPLMLFPLFALFCIIVDLSICPLYEIYTDIHCTSYR